MIINDAMRGAVAMVSAFGLFSWKKKKADGSAGQSAAAPGQPSPDGTQARPKTQAEKTREWMDYERMYGRPHPEAPGWVTPGGAAANAPKPKCPMDEITVSFEPYTGQYFCSRCGQRYTSEQVFKKEEELLEHSRQSEGEIARAPAEEAPRPPVGEKLEISSAPPTWSMEHGETMSGEQIAAAPSPPEAGAPKPPQEAGLAAAPAEARSAPPTATPLEASPVTSEGPVPEAAPVMPEGVNPEAGPIFNMPKAIDYSDLPPPPPAKEPPKLGEEEEQH